MSRLYGDKEDIEIGNNILKYTRIIEDAAKSIKAAEKAEKEITKKINDAIKKMDKDSTEASNKTRELSKDKEKNSGEIKSLDEKVKLLDKQVQVYRAYCNDLTVFYGAYVGALKDRNRQAKAICVKALSYKHEAATVAESGTYGDIFSGVEIV